MTEEQARAIFTLAGIEVKNLYRLPNGYWPDCPDYKEIRDQNPWWLVNTVKYGLIKIGCRKRVISIDWEDTLCRFSVTTDDVTKEDWMVHAWTYYKAVEYLTNFVQVDSEKTRIKAELAKAEYVKKTQV